MRVLRSSLFVAATAIIAAACGDKVNVQVVRVNMDLRQIELGLVEILERVRARTHGPRRSRVTPKHESRRKQRPGRREREKVKGKKRR